MKRKISFFYQNIEWAATQMDDLKELISMHKKSFEYYDWEVIHVDHNSAKTHPLFEFFMTQDQFYKLSQNEIGYTRSCYIRWLAYAQLGHYYADYDVMNYGFSPKDAAHVVALGETNPVFTSGAGAMGLLSPKQYDMVISTFVEVMENPDMLDLAGADVNDMNLLRILHPDWFSTLKYEDTRYVKDYTSPHWEKASLVHYPYHHTPMPRSETIRSARPISAGGPIRMARAALAELLRRR